MARFRSRIHLCSLACALGVFGGPVAAALPQAAPHIGVETDYAEMEELRRMAARGDVKAQHRLASILLEHEDLESVFGSARSWLESAATAGSADAQAALGLLIATEIDGEDPSKALESVSLVRAAALKGSPVAAHEYALILMDRGWGEPDIPGAVEMLRRSAAQRYAPAMAHLGALIVTGVAYSPDPSEGQRLIADAAEAGDPDGLMYEAERLAAEADSHDEWVVAMGLMERAATVGSRAKAQLNLGQMYLGGPSDFTGQSVEQATRWLGRAASQGDQEAVSRYNALVAQLPQVAAAVSISFVMEQPSPDGEPIGAVSVEVPGRLVADPGEEWVTVALPTFVVGHAPRREVTIGILE